jgi:hypothetical protein
VRRILVIAALLVLVSPAQARKPGSLRELAHRVSTSLTERRAVRFMRRLARRENPFYQPGVGLDARTGMTFDGVNIDFRTGKPVETRNWSAPSKESLHVAMLVKAVAGDRTAQTLFSPSARRPGRGATQALAILERKIATYERFNRDFPGFGGFLPWYRVSGDRIEPQGKGRNGWQTRVPGLDNGQLAWSLYYAANTLKALGHTGLARRYSAHLELMQKNVVRVFYDPGAKKMRAEASLLRGNRRAPQKNVYALNPDNPYYLDDPYEGLMLCHFADLFGNWSANPEGRQAIWSTPRRQPASYRVRAPGQPKLNGKRVTIAKSWVGSSHEDWGELFLPFTDVKLARTLFENAQRVRTLHSATRGIPGLFASTHSPTDGTTPTKYVSKLGFIGKSATLDRAVSQRIIAPYAAFPIALARGGRTTFATWLKTMVQAPRMLGPYGMGESCSTDGKGMAPCLTWDGKALPMLAWMGGIRDEVRAHLKRDGLYSQFLRRVEGDLRLFKGRPIHGVDLPLARPTTKVPRGMGGFERR